MHKPERPAQKVSLAIATLANVKPFNICLLCVLFLKRGVLEGGWLQVRSSHFNKKFSLFTGH